MAAATRSRTASITARTSAADPPSLAWMKLACFSDTQAVPIRRPRRPRPSISPPAVTSPGHRVHEHRSAVLPTRLMLAAPAHDLGDLSLGRLAIAAPEVEADLDDELVVGEIRAAEPQAEVARRRAPASTHRRHDRSIVAEIEDVDVDECRGHVGAVSTGVHPHRAADGSRNADRPLEPGHRRGGRSAGEHRQGDATAGGDDDAAVGVGRRRSAIPFANSASDTAMPGKPESATSRFEPRPIASTCRPRRRLRRRDATEVVDRRHLDEQARPDRRRGRS